jgi:hypothetical protein
VAPPHEKPGRTILRRDAGEVTIKPEQAKVSVYFKVDNGSEKISGVPLKENEEEYAILET